MHVHNYYWRSNTKHSDRKYETHLREVLEEKLHYFIICKQKQMNKEFQILRNHSKEKTGPLKHVYVLILFFMLPLKRKKKSVLISCTDAGEVFLCADQNLTLLSS